jgi:hypothetical protein
MYGKLLTLTEIEFMLTVRGFYENGMIKLEKQVDTHRALSVIVTFLEEDTNDNSKRLTLKEFSFSKARSVSKGYKGCLSDAVIEERKTE